MLIELRAGLSIDPSKVSAVTDRLDNGVELIVDGFPITTYLPYDEVIMALETAKYPTGKEGRARNRAIIKAVEQGQTYRQVADYYGLTYQRVHQIYNNPALDLRRGGDPVGG